MLIDSFLSFPLTVTVSGESYAWNYVNLATILFLSSSQALGSKQTTDHWVCNKELCNVAISGQVPCNPVLPPSCREGKLWQKPFAALRMSQEWQSLKEWTPTENLEWSYMGGWLCITKPSGNSCSRSGPNHVGLSLPVDLTSAEREGVLATGHPRSFIPAPLSAPWRDHPSGATRGSTEWSLWAQITMIFWDWRSQN